ncbi:hypothetical protein [Bacillus sp. MYb209]|uniref:hypothetical protein n=1 Tax=Bacillus sp. MYb209 TaxID=1848605 RepID=UPI0015E32077|nr:hypothetical protein [Bacillus sp. MYb209]
MKKFFWLISTMCIAIGLAAGCSNKDDTGFSVTRDVVEIDQQKGSEKKQNKKEQDSNETASIPVKKRSIRVNYSTQNWSSKR